MTTMIVASVATGALATIASVVADPRSVILREVVRTTLAGLAHRGIRACRGRADRRAFQPQGAPQTVRRGSATSVPIWETLTSRST